MLDVSDRVKRAYKDDDFVPDLQIYFEGKAFGSDSILDSSMTIRESLCSQDELTFTAVESSTFSATLIADEDPTQQLIGKAATVTHVTDLGGLYLGPDTFLGPNTFMFDPEEKVLLGTFTIETVTRSGDGLYDIDGFDYNKKLQDADISEWWNSEVTFPTTIKALLESLAKHVGLTTDLPDSWANSNMPVLQNVYFDGGTTAAELLGMIQEISGCFFRCGRDGILRRVNYSAVKTAIDYTLLMEDPEIEMYSVPKIDKLQIHASDDDVGAIVGTGQNAYISTGNVLVYGMNQEDLDEVAANALKAMSTFPAYVPFDAKCVNQAYVEVGDIVEIQTLDGAKASAVLMDREMTGAMLMEDSITVNGNESRENVESPLKGITVLNRKMHELVNTVDEMSSTMSSIETTQKGTILGQTTYWLQTVSGGKPETDDPGWTTQPSAFIQGNHVWQMTVTYYVDPKRPPHYSDPVEITSPSVEDVETWYIYSSSYEEIVSGNGLFLGPDTYLGYNTYMTYPWGLYWVKEPPEFSPGLYLWTRQKLVYSDGTEIWTDPTCNYHLNDVYAHVVENETKIYQTNEQIKLTATRKELESTYSELSGRIETEKVDRDAAIKVAADNITLQVEAVSESRATSFTIWYIQMNEGEIPTKDSIGWTTETIPWVNGRHIWQMTETVYGEGEDARTAYSRPVDITGARGQDGASGESIEIVSSELRYCSSASGTSIPSSGWTPNLPSVPSGHYLWTRTTVTYSDGSKVSTYTTSRQGADGAHGANGEPGVGIVNEEIFYKNSPSRENYGSDTGWSTSQPEIESGQYLWSKRVIHYSDGSEQAIYKCELQITSIYDIAVSTSARVETLDDRVTTTVTTVTEFKNAFDSYKLEQSSTITALSDRITALVTEKVDSETVQSMIDQTADEIVIRVQDAENEIGDVKDDLSQNYTRKAEIVANINNSSSQVKISAEHIDLDGVVTFVKNNTDYVTASDLSTSGKTTISGGNVTTGIISDSTGQNYWNLQTGEIKITLLAQLEDDFNNLSIAGTNLFTGTKDWYGWTLPDGAAISSTEIDGFKVLDYTSQGTGSCEVASPVSSKLMPEAWYTLSFYVMASRAFDVVLGNWATEISCSETGASIANYEVRVPYILNEYKRVWIKFKTASWVNTGENIWFRQDRALSSLNLYAVKFEKGEVATEWTPSYNDEKDYVRKAEIITEINNDLSHIRISADHLDLNGVVTFLNNGNYFITDNDLQNAGSTVINGSNIKTGSINASLIKTGSLSADLINTGTLDADKVTVKSSNSSMSIEMRGGAIFTSNAQGYKGMDILAQHIDFYSFSDPGNRVGFVGVVENDSTGKKIMGVACDSGDAVALERYNPSDQLYYDVIKYDDSDKSVGIYSENFDIQGGDVGLRTQEGHLYCIQKIGAQTYGGSVVMGNGNSHVFMFGWSNDKIQVWVDNTLVRQL